MTKLAVLSVVLGLGFALPHLYGVLKPSMYRDAVREFPRSEMWGYILMAVGTLWFLWNLKQENISDFAAYKNLMMVAFGLLGIATCVYVKDFLAVRGLAIVLMLLAKLMVDTARWADTPWRLVIITLAYLMVIAGIWFIISPWRLRDLIQWSTQSDQRVRVGSSVPLALGMAMALLGLTVF
jgi:hypothetical protein